jgi:pheromone shutdown protein TraB
MSSQQIPVTQQVFRLAGIYAALAVLAVLVPRWAARTQEGLAAGATAVVTFLALGGLASLVAAYLFFIVVKNFRQLAPLLRFAGMLPLILTLVAAVAAWAYLLF